MKKNLKKLLSLLTALTILFTMAGIPAMAEEVTVDFTRETGGNLAYGIEITHISGTYYGSTGSPKTAGNRGKLTDGVLSSDSRYYAYPAKTKGTVAFQVNLGASYNLSEIAIYVDKARTMSIYAGTVSDYTQQTLVTESAAVSTTVNGFAAYELSVDVSQDLVAQYVTFVDSTGESSTNFYEILVKGTEVTTGGGTEPEQPETPAVPTKTVNFSEAANIAYGKTITPIQGYYYSSSTPSATKQLATDGDITTFHSGYGKVSGQTVGVTFSLDLGKTYKLSQIDLYLAEVGQANRSYKLYKGTAVDEANLIATVPASNATAIVNGTEVAANSFAITGDVETQYLTFYYPEGYGFAYSELYITGTEVTTGGGTTEPEEPEVPAVPTETVNFAEAANVAYGKIITPIAGAYYSSGPKPSATNQKATDGDINTLHSGYGRATTASSSEKTGVVFSMDLGKEYNLENVVIYVSQTQRYAKLYSGTSVDESKLLLTTTCDNVATTVNGKENMYKLTGAFPADTKAQYLTFNYPEGSGFPYCEIYVKGTEGTTGGGGTTDPEEPEVPAGETVDFSQNNLVYKTTSITRVEGSTAAKFTSNSPKMVDGDLSTHYEWSGGPTATFTIDLGAEYTLTDFVLYEKSFNRGFAVALSTDGSTTTNTKEVTSADFVQTTVNGTDVYKGALAYTTETARYITVSYPSKYSFIVGELLVKGTPVTTGGGTTEPEEPEVPVGTTVNFKTEKNLAYGKTITPKSGKNYYTKSSTTPSATSQLATDGDITTWHMAAGRKNISWGTQVGSEFNLDFGKTRVIKSVDLYVQAGMYDGIDSATGEYTGNYRTHGSMSVNVYGGEDSATGTLIGTMTKPAGLESIAADGKTMDMYIYHIDFPENSEYSVITFDNPKNAYFGYNEIYVTYEMIDEDYMAVVTADKEALDLGNTSMVISDLALPLVGANGSTITWATTDASVVATDGTVVRGSENQTVTLTATITNGSATDTKTFEITVLGTETDDGKVASDKAALDLGDTSAVTENLTLPVLGANGSTIVWRTNNPAVVQADGTVHRDLDSKRATLTATITYGNAFDTKQFVVTVLGTVTDEQRVASDKEALTLGDTTAVTGSLTLPTVGTKGSAITWATSDASVITKDGVVTRGDADKTATLTATIKYGDVTDTKVFTVTVLKKVVISGTVDFSAAENVAYGKLVTPVAGRDKYAQSSVAPDEANNYTTDGDITTFHMGATRSNVSWGTTVGSEFTIDLAETYTIESADLFTQPEMYNGYSATPNSNKSLKIYVFGDGNKDTGTLVGQMIIPAATTTISDGTNELEVCVYHIDFPVNSNYSTLSFYSDSGYFWGWNEVYVKGESSVAANVVDDKKALEFGDLNDVVESLTLPTVGAVKGSAITWATTDASVIETDGTVHRAEHTKKAKLTATITKGDVSDTKEFYVTVLGTYANHYVINSDDFSEPNDVKYVVNKTTDSTAMVNTETNKYEMTRNASGELSAKKYFVTERSDMPYSVIGDKVVQEQLMAVRDGLEGVTAEIRNKNDELIATYGIKKEGADYVFFLNVGGREQSILYAYGDEIFTRVELITENGASRVTAFVGTEYGVTNVAEFPLAASVHPSMTTVKYTANEGNNGKLILDGVKFMIEGTDKDAIAVTIETENFKNSHITTQNFDAIIGNLSLKANSIFDCKYSYESDNPDVISSGGFVTRPLEDTPVTLTVTIKKGESSKNLTFNLIVKGLADDNMAMDNLILSSGAIEGSSDKNAVDGLDETAFITAAPEKFFALSFNEETTFNIVTLFEAKNESDEYGVTGFKIEVSDNGIDWETVYTGTTVGEQFTAEFDQVTTKYVRYYVTGLTGNQTGLREFVITYDPVPEVAVELDLKKVTITPNNYVVTGDLTLQTEGEYGSVITWKSSHPDIITDDGRLISTPDKTTTIKLTATLTNGGFTRTKEFTLSVQGSSTGEDISGDNGGSEKPGGVSGGGSGGGGSGGGGGGGSDDDEDPKPVAPTPVDPTPSADGFKDVETDRWSYNYIMELKEAGIVSGDGENFRPTDKVTREEFVKMLVLSLGITPGGTADFSDVDTDAWHHDYIAVAVEKGIVQGISDTEFGIGRFISRQDMAVMTVRALQALQVELQGGEAPVFTDEHEIADYAEDAVKILAAAGILNGSDGKFAPTDNLTREQAAKVLCMIRKELTK